MSEALYSTLQRGMTSTKKDREGDAVERLDRVFAALSDPARRAILERLQTEALLVSELAAPFEISLQAVSRHIQVLEDAGLIQKERTGRISRCTLVAGPILDAAVWINRYSKYWQSQFDLLAVSLEALERGRIKPTRDKSVRNKAVRATGERAVNTLTPRGVRARRVPGTSTPQAAEKRRP
jgi:DNA-binding transcriptional ArsR family regulator